MLEGSGDPPLRAFREGITTPFIAMSLAWYSARASPVDCFRQSSVGESNSSALLVLVGDDV